jgi:VWFA-related protein
MVFFPRMLIATVTMSLLLTAFGRSQQSPSDPTPAAPAQQSTVKIKTNETLLDVIVLDKKQRPIHDIKLEEIEIFEDGVKQPITNFVHLGNAGDNMGSPAGSVARAETSPGGLKSPHLVTLLFDHLNVQRVQPVRDAAYTFVDNIAGGEILVRVLVVGKRLYCIEQFTNDRARLRKAVERATSTVEKSFAGISDPMMERLQQVAGETAKEPSTPEALQARLTLDAVRGAEKLSQANRGGLRVFSLLPLARAYRLAPGRKMALYFSDGMALPSGATEALQAIVSESNRANLSFYSVNIRTLLAGAGNQVSRLETSTVVNQTRRPESSSYNSDLANSFSVSDRFANRRQIRTNFSTFEVLDRNNQLNKLNPLTRLTEDTGGFQITNINDLNGAIKRSILELGRYYAVSYLPTNQETDGKFRVVTVKISRPGAKAQTRSGYFASPNKELTRPTLSYETPLLAALQASTPPENFSYRLGTFHFESRRDKINCVAVVQVPLSTFLHSKQNAGKSISVKFAVLGMIKNESGEVVHRFSEPYEYDIPAEMIEGLKKSGLTLTRQFWTEPGKYVFESVIQDQNTNKISVQRKNFTLGATPSSSEKPGLQTSSLFLIQQVEEIPAGDGDVDNPLVAGDKKLTPELERELSIEGRNELSFHLAIFPDAARTEKPTLKLELVREGQTIASAAADLPKQDASGRILFTAGVPMAGLKPGTYEFHAVVEQSGAKIEESTAFKLTGGGSDELSAPEEKTIESVLATSDKVPPLRLQALKTIRAIEVSPSDLIKQVKKSGEQAYTQLGDYTYNLRKVRRGLTASGKIKSEEYQDFEAYPIKGKHALIQLADNGAPLSTARRDLSRKTAIDALVKSEGESQSETQKTNSGYWGASMEGAVQTRGKTRRIIFLTIDPEILFDACEFTAPRSLLLEGRETILMNFRPHRDLKLDPDKEWVSKLIGTVWIDAAEKSLVRIEGYDQRTTTPEDLNADTKLQNFVYQQQQVGPNVWAPSLIRINTGGNEDLFYGLNWDAWFEFGNYKRFDTKAIDSKVLTPDNKKQDRD